MFDRYIRDTCVISGSMAQPEVCFSTQDLQLIRQCVVAAFSEHPYFKELTNRHIPKGTATKSELAQASKYAKSGIVVNLSIPAPAMPCLM